jgi:hypothetical protein
LTTKDVPPIVIAFPDPSLRSPEPSREIRPPAAASCNLTPRTILLRLLRLLRLFPAVAAPARPPFPVLFLLVAARKPLLLAIVIVIIIVIRLTFLVLAIIIPLLILLLILLIVAPEIANPFSQRVDRTLRRLVPERVN